MGFDLSALITPIEGLEILTKPFEKDEMDKVVKHMPVDKAPGPDGFNGLFFKKCWHIISQDFYELDQDFFEGSAVLVLMTLTLLLYLKSPHLRRLAIIGLFLLLVWV